MQKALKTLQWIFSVATIIITLLLCWQCLDIYLTGNLSENINAGVYISPVYSLEIVSARLSKLTPLLAIYGVLAIANIVMHLGFGKAERPAGKIRRCPVPKQPGKMQRIARIAILCLGVFFIILGMMNGGSRDVLVKAINICTECIGLG